MKFVCLGYYDPKQMETWSEGQRNSMFDECLAYDDVLRSGGHYAGGTALDLPERARTLRWENGKVMITDGPFTETKEQIGGILLLEARDLEHALELMSKHPGVKNGPFEIRAVWDMEPIQQASEKRRGKR